MGTDYNLLFGVLALQVELITHEQFVEACALWAHRKQAPLADILVERGWLSADSRREVERLVERKLRKHGGDARASLAEAAGEPIQRSLAAVADAEIQQSLAQLPHLNVALVATVAYQPGSRDRYTLSRLHAKGGIGQVWVARDEEIGREIALKELRPERAEEAALVQRFLSEARITGQLEHPGIVPVYALARHPESGQPFYTMRFVRGRTLGEAIASYHACLRGAAADERPLPLRNLLNAFVAVCNAVAYAHSRGVVHRDLKPSNVVLGDFGEVMVLDWGLAKLLGQADPAGEASPIEVETSSQTGGTVQGAVMGTPAYMAPEQADGRTEAIDARTDVYGLGAILYELLTGQPPFTGGETHEILRRVQHEMPPRPRTLRKAVPTALEAICLKALAKLRSDRYAAARDLADDVQHWLADEPVAAYAEPLSMRVRRWGRRHRTLVASGVVALGMAALTLTVMTLSLNAKNAAMAAAHARESAARRQAQTNFDLAKDAVEKYLDKVTENEKLKQADFHQLRKELLETAIPFYQKFVNQQSDDPELEATRGRALGRLAAVRGELGETAATINELREMQTIFEKLAESYPDQGDYRHHLGLSHTRLGSVYDDVGRYSESLAHYDAALSIRTELCAQFPDQSAYRVGLAGTHNDCGLLLAYLGRLKEAMNQHEHALALRQALVAASPDQADYRDDVAQSHGNLGSVLNSLNRPRDAETQLRKSLEIRGQLLAEAPQHPHRREAEMRSRRNLAGLLGDLGRYGEATECYESAIRASARLTEEFPSLPRFRDWLATGHSHYGLMLGRQDKTAEAMAEHRKAIDIRKQLAADFPQIPDYRDNLASSYNNLAMEQKRSDDTAEAMRNYQLARDMYAVLASDFPSVPVYRHHLANAHHNQGMLWRVLNAPAEAERQYLAALNLREELVKTHPQVSNHTLNLGKTYVMLGDVVAEKPTRHREALGYFSKAIDALEAVAGNEPELVEPRGPLRSAHWWKASLLASSGQVAQSAPHWDRAVQLSENYGKAPFLRFKRAWAWVYAGEHAKSLAEVNELEKLGPSDDFELQDLALLCALSAAKIIEGKSTSGNDTSSNDAKAALPYADRAMELLRKAVASGYDDLAALKSHRDWAALRTRSDFQSLLGEIEARQAKGKK